MPEVTAVEGVVKNNYMPIYKIQCVKCGNAEEVFFGKILDRDIIDMECKKCGCVQGRKIPSAINSANFTAGSRRSLKTRTGVGEVQFRQGARQEIEKANS